MKKIKLIELKILTQRTYRTDKSMYVCPILVTDTLPLLLVRVLTVGRYWSLIPGRLKEMLMTGLTWPSYEGTTLKRQSGRQT